MGYPGTEHVVGTRGRVARGGTARSGADGRRHPTRHRRRQVGELEAGVWWTACRRHSRYITHPDDHGTPWRATPPQSPCARASAGGSPYGDPAGTILAINSDAKAQIFAEADIGIVADWATCVPLLAAAFEQA